MVKKQITFKVFSFVFFIAVFFQINALATDVDFEYTNDDFNKDEKIITDSAVSILENVDFESDSWKEKTMFSYELNPIINGLANKNRFCLNDYKIIDLEVHNQKDTQECWAFSIFTSMETNLLIKNGVKIDFSERHMDYATSNSLYGAEEGQIKYNRPVRTGAITETGLAYLTNGQGAVLEDDLEFENDMNSIPYSDIEINPEYYVTEYLHIPSIFKSYDSEGNITYYNAYGNEYSIDDVNDIRRSIKQYIVENGALVSVMASKYVKGYDNTDDITKATSFCCKDSTQNRDHAITIVGWDDNYDRENFNEKNRPKSNGAYIVLQSYGEHFFDKGYIYISYEDYLIETSLYGICGSSKYDYDNLYQNDFYGANGTMYLKNYQTGYLATCFTRDKSKSEILSKVSVNIPQNASVEVWINPKGTDLSEKNLIKVSKRSKVLEPGYHTIDIEPTKLKGDSFAVIIKQISESGDFYFNVEYQQESTYFYQNVDSEYGRSQVSIDGKEWELLAEQGKNSKSEQALLTADLCIKAFTYELTDD